MTYEEFVASFFEGDVGLSRAKNLVFSVFLPSDAIFCTMPYAKWTDHIVYFSDPFPECIPSLEYANDVTELCNEIKLESLADPSSWESLEGMELEEETQLMKENNPVAYAEFVKVNRISLTITYGQIAFSVGKRKDGSYKVLEFVGD